MKKEIYAFEQQYFLKPKDHGVYSPGTIEDFMGRFEGAELVARNHIHDQILDKIEGVRYSSREVVWHLSPIGVTMNYYWFYSDRNLTGEKEEIPFINLRVALFGEQAAIDQAQKRILDSIDKYNAAKQAKQQAETALETLVL